MKKEEKKTWPMHYSQVEDELSKVAEEWNQDGTRRAILVNDILRDQYEETLPYVGSVDTTEQLLGCLYSNVTGISTTEAQKVLEIYAKHDESFSKLTRKQIEKGCEEAVTEYQAFYDRRGSKI